MAYCSAFSLSDGSAGVSCVAAQFETVKRRRENRVEKFFNSISHPIKKITIMWCDAMCRKKKRARKVATHSLDETTHTRVYAVAQYFSTTNGINLLIYHISFGFLPPHSPPSISHWKRVEFLCQNTLGLIQPEKPLDMSSTTLRKLSWPEYRCCFALCNRKTYSPRLFFVCPSEHITSAIELGNLCWCLMPIATMDRFPPRSLLFRLFWLLLCTTIDRWLLSKKPRA